MVNLEVQGQLSESVSRLAEAFMRSRKMDVREEIEFIIAAAAREVVRSSGIVEAARAELINALAMDKLHNAE